MMTLHLHELSPELLMLSDSDNHDTADIPPDELPPSWNAHVLRHGIDAIPPELPLNSDICHPGQSRDESMDTVSDENSQTDTDSNEYCLFILPT